MMGYLVIRMICFILFGVSFWTIIPVLVVDRKINVWAALTNIVSATVYAYYSGWL